MDLTRSSGILLHPTSLPGHHGIGDLGENAYWFIDFLTDAGQSWWQVMPLGPTGYGDSPYQSFSAFAGNPMLLDLEALAEEGLIDPDQLSEGPGTGDDYVDYGPVQTWKMGLLSTVHKNFMESADDALRSAYLAFTEANQGWLEDYALFMALKEHFGKAWPDWPAEIRDRAPQALSEYRDQLADDIRRHRMLQFLFERQWQALKSYARDRGIQLIGDAPIFVAHDSADVWTHRDLFFLDETGNPTVVAGVPPDYFSETGQRWGNPLYRWDRLAEQGYAWWVARLRKAFEQFDLMRLDHFRGFEAYWEIPAEEETAVNGRWVPGPGAALLHTLREQLGHLPIIAEDLGVITPEVEKLRDDFGLPGMRVLQFAFDGESDNVHLPHCYVTNCIVYTGTHDNDTTRGWWDKLDADAQYEVLRYLGRHHLPPLRIAPQLIRQAMRSVARVAIFPLQDILNLGSAARMNTPSAESGNWRWRFRPQALTGHLSTWLREMTGLYGRLPAARLSDGEAQEARPLEQRADTPS